MSSWSSQNVVSNSNDIPETWHSMASIGLSRYLISTRGRFASLLTHNEDGTPYLPRLNLSGGYLCAWLSYDDGKPRNTFVHRALARVFHGPKPTPGHVAAHRNDIKVENSPSNIYWATRSQNWHDSVRNGARIIGSDPRAWGRRRDGLTIAQVRSIRSRVDAGETAVEIAKALALRYRTVFDVVRGKTYQWVKSTVVEQEKARIDAERRLEQERQKVAVDREAAALVALELATGGARRRYHRSPHTPAASAPLSKGSR